LIVGVCKPTLFEKAYTFGYHDYRMEPREVLDLFNDKLEYCSFDRRVYWNDVNNYESDLRRLSIDLSRIHDHLGSCVLNLHMTDEQLNHNIGLTLATTNQRSSYYNMDGDPAFTYGIFDKIYFACESCYASWIVPRSGRDEEVTEWLLGWLMNHPCDPSWHPDDGRLHNIYPSEKGNGFEDLLSPD